MDKTDNQGNPDNPEKTDQSDKTDKTDKTDNPDNPDKTDNDDKTDKTDTSHFLTARDPIDAIAIRRSWFPAARDFLNTIAVRRAYPSVFLLYSVCNWGDAVHAWRLPGIKRTHAKFPTPGDVCLGVGYLPGGAPIRLSSASTVDGKKYNEYK